MTVLPRRLLLVREASSYYYQSGAEDGAHDAQCLRTVHLSRVARAPRGSSSMECLVGVAPTSTVLQTAARTLEEAPGGK